MDNLVPELPPAQGTSRGVSRPQMTFDLMCAGPVQSCPPLFQLPGLRPHVSERAGLCCPAIGDHRSLHVSFRPSLFFRTLQV